MRLEIQGSEVKCLKFKRRNSTEPECLRVKIWCQGLKVRGHMERVYNKYSESNEVQGQKSNVKKHKKRISTDSD